MEKGALHVIDWQTSDAVQRKGWAKRAVYAAIRPILSANARRYLSPGFLSGTRPDAVYFSRGMPLEWRRSWGAAQVAIRSATLLVQGTGTGWDVVSWAETRPLRIIATDLFSFDESWEQVARHCHDKLGVPVEFRAAPLEDHGFLRSGSVDICASDAVFEHCTDLRAVLGETHRLLRAGGSVYASYGPVWFAPGGDHFSERGGLSNVYNHIALSAENYRRYFEKHRAEREEFQSGERYIELGLFSKLTTRQYLAAFAEADFDRDGLIVELSAGARAFRRQFPAEFSAILKKTWIYAPKMIC